MGKIYEALQRASLSPTDDETTEAVLDPPHLEIAPELVVLTRPGSALAEQFRFLRSKVIRPGAKDGPKTILITSALQGEGKTFVAANLAAAIAQGMDEYVLLVDADMRKPNAHTLFGLPQPELGLSSHLKDNVSLKNMLLKTSIDKLTFLPAGTSAENPVELLASQKMKAFIAEVRNRYPDRVVIFDSPPIEVAPESMVMANAVDGVFLVLQRASTPRDAVQSALDKLEHDRFLGVILNKDRHASQLYKRYKRQKNGYGYSTEYKYGS